MEKTNKYILWKIFDYCKFIDVFNTGLVSKTIRRHVVQYMYKNKYCNYYKDTHIVNSCTNKLQIPDYYDNISISHLCPNITHLTINKFDDNVKQYLPNIEYLNCSSFDAYNCKFNKLKHVIVRNYHAPLVELIKCIPNIEIIKGNVDVNACVSATLKEIHIRNFNYMANYYSNSVDINNFPQLREFNICHIVYPIDFFVTNNNPFIVSNNIHNNIKKIIMPKGLTSNYKHNVHIKGVDNMINLQKLVLYSADVKQATLFGQLFPNIRLKNVCSQMIENKRKVNLLTQLNKYIPDQHISQYTNARILKYHTIRWDVRQLDINHIIKLFPNINKLKLYHTTCIEHFLAASFKHINDCKLYKIKFKSIHLKHLSRLANNIPSLTKICTGTIMNAGAKKQKIHCLNIKTLHIHNQHNGEKAKDILYVAKTFLPNLENILLSINFDDISLQWIKEHFRNIKTISCTGGNFWIQYNLKNILNDIQWTEFNNKKKLVKYIIINGNILYDYCLQSIMSLVYTGKKNKLVIHLLK